MGCFVPAPSFFITFLNQSELHTNGCLQASCLLLDVKHLLCNALILNFYFQTRLRYRGQIYSHTLNN